MERAIMTPTMTRTGAVAAPGTKPKRGSAKIASTKQAAVVSDVRPVLPPSAIPAED